MYYPEELVEEVRMKNDIVDVISGYVRLQKKGSSYFGLCPFHNEKSPSFSVTPAKQMYYCFGCGAGGNVFTFVQNYENYSFPEAVKYLADRAGVPLPEMEYSEEAKKRENKRSQLLEINKLAANYFYYQLRAKQGEGGYRYFKDRQLSEETMKKFALGYSNVAGNDLSNYLKYKGYKDNLIVEAGLGSVDEKYGLHDKFWNRVMFPIQDINHRVIGFGGRVMGEGKPKYLNSPETMIFDKSRNLYGLNFARSQKAGNIIICEGYMDVIAMHQAGFTQAVASLGTAFTVGQASLLKRYTEQVLLSYDSDGAGTGAALRALGILREVGLSGKIIKLDPYKDPDEFIKNLGAEEFQKRIDNAQNSFEFEIDVMKRDYDLNDPDSKTKFHREIAKKLCNFEDADERDNYMQFIAQKYQIGLENLKGLVVTYAAKTGLVKPVVRAKPSVQTKDTVNEAPKRVQKLLITWISDDPKIYKTVKKFISLDDFTEELYRQVAEKLFSDIEKDIYNPAAIISMFQDEEQQRQVAELFSTKLQGLDTPADKEKALRDILVKVKENSQKYYEEKTGSDVNALMRAINAKRELEELKKTHISLNEG